MSQDESKSESRDLNPTADVPFGSNEIRLSLAQWCVALAIIVALLICLPFVWTAIESFDPGPDYRVPHALSNDYWVYRRLVKAAMAKGKILVIGDSVIWGEYVRPSQTLSQALNGHRDAEQFVNGGVNGTHPLALEGLIRHYGKGIADTRVILHCNLLWMSSPERDLRTERPIAFNHPRLLPQLTRTIPAYQASVSKRMGITIDRLIPFRSWVHHIRVSSFAGLDLHTWSIEHPYGNPIGQIGLRTAAPSRELRHQPISWIERGIDRQDLPWVRLDTSLQWQAFRKSVALLRKRHNRVFVLVGPFNEHMLTENSRSRYRAARREVERWLAQKGVFSYAPPPLPSSEYADASHPLDVGYVRLAGEIAQTPSFLQWLGEP